MTFESFVKIFIIGKLMRMPHFSNSHLLSHVTHFFNFWESSICIFGMGEQCDASAEHCG